jgi:hypothetical protein
MIVNLQEIHTRYINLQQDVAKNDKMIQMLSNNKDFLRVDATYIDGNSILALSKSQRKALESLPVPGVILEDDCVKFNYLEEIDVPDDADIVFLGIWKPERPLFNSGDMIPSYEEYNKDWVRVYSMVGSHAIMYVSDKGKDVALKAYDLAIRTGLWNDIVLSRALPFINTYALKKPIFYQTSMEQETKVLYTEPFVKNDNGWHTPEILSADDLLNF